MITKGKMSHKYLTEEPKTPIKEKLARIKSQFLPGRLGFSFYIGRKEVFIGLEVSKVIIPVKTKRIKLDTTHAKVTFVPTRE